MPHLTEEEFLEQIENCDYLNDQKGILQTLYEDGPNAVYQEMVNEMHIETDSMYNYLRDIFPERELADWQGTDEIVRTYNHPYIPIDFSIFKEQQLQPCDITDSAPCFWDYCKTPQGGITQSLPPRMWRWAYETEPICTENIRTSAIAKQLVKIFVNERFAVEDATMSNFYLMAMIQSLGHKFVLELAPSEEDGSMQPIQSYNPFNFTQAYRYAYYQELFPGVANLENVGPLDFQTLDVFGQSMTNFRMKGYRSVKGPRGEPIFTILHGSDWFRNEMLVNPEYVERMKYTVPTKLLPGYRDAGDYKSDSMEVVGNFAMQQVQAMPRFAVGPDGGLMVVQPYKAIDDTDLGHRYVPNYREYANAPFGLAAIIGDDIGNILTRPQLKTDVTGIPINPIAANGPWGVWNKYDPTCNPEENMPRWRKKFELGYKPKNPENGTGIVYRNKLMQLRASATCALRPLFKVADPAQSCDVTTIGCRPAGMESNNIMSFVDQSVRKVECSSAACGSADGLSFNLKIRRENWDVLMQDQNPLGTCDCGDTVNVFINDADGNTVRVQPATVTNRLRPSISMPRALITVTLEDALGAGECISYIACQDETPAVATVLHCEDNSDDSTIPVGSVRFILDGPIGDKGEGDSVTITYKDAAGSTLGATVAGTIVAINVENMSYLISSANTTGQPGGTAPFNCYMRVGQEEVTIA